MEILMNFLFTFLLFPVFFFFNIGYSSSKNNLYDELKKEFEESQINASGIFYFDENKKNAQILEDEQNNFLNAMGQIFQQSGFTRPSSDKRDKR